MVANRSTLCDHCSLRRDLPGFISAQHVDGNIDRIKNGGLFKCHMIANQHEPEARVCLGAALVARAELDHPVGGNLPPVYDTLDDYRETQVAGRVSNDFLATQDRWTDSAGRQWFGWWTRAPAGNWHYLMSSLAGNANESVYLFFDQCEKLFGPLDKV